MGIPESCEELKEMESVEKALLDLGGQHCSDVARLEL